MRTGLFAASGFAGKTRQILAFRASIGDAARGVLIGTLPVVILAVSPQRVLLSIAVAAIYAVAALVLVRPERMDRLVLIYVGVAAAFVALSLLRAERDGSLDTAQKEYALAKAEYFDLAVLPISAAVALLVARIGDLRPAAVGYAVVGVVLSMLTVGLCNPGLFGEQRYAWQGNLAALGGLVLIQFWVLKRFWLVALLTAVSLAGVAFANSKQSVVAVAIGLLVTAAYWLLADRRGGAGKGRWQLPRTSKLPVVLVVAALFGLAAWVYLEYARTHHLLAGSWLPHNPAAQCGRVAERFVVLGESAGARDNLVATGWQLFTQSPVVGSGLGSFLGLVRGYKYPHNVPLEVAGEMGIIGVAVLLLPLIVGWVRLLGAGVRARSHAIAGLMAIVLVFAVVANLSGDLPSARALWIFGLVAFKFGFAPTEAVESPQESVA